MQRNGNTVLWRAALTATAVEMLEEKTEESSHINSIGSDRNASQ
jgi:hypothetical protein